MDKTRAHALLMMMMMMECERFSMSPLSVRVVIVGISICGAVWSLIVGHWIESEAMVDRAGAIFYALRWNVNGFQCLPCEFGLWASGFRFAERFDCWTLDRKWSNDWSGWWDILCIAMKYERFSMSPL